MSVAVYHALLSVGTMTSRREPRREPRRASENLAENLAEQGPKKALFLQISVFELALVLPVQAPRTSNTSSSTQFQACCTLSHQLHGDERRLK